MQIINNSEALQVYASDFTKTLDAHMHGAMSGAEMSSKALDGLFDMFSEITPSGGFMVRPHADIGVQADIFDGIEKETWFLHLYNPTLDFSGISLYTVDEAQKWFLETLSVNLLANIPKDLEEAAKHIKRHIYSMFNGSNRNHLKFDLVYVDYQIFAGEYTESMDLGDFLIV